MARLGLDINLALQRLLGANKERAAANRGALEDRKLRKENAEQKAQLANGAPGPGSPTGAEEIRGGTPQLYRAPEPAAQRRKKGVKLYGVSDPNGFAVDGTYEQVSQQFTGYASRSPSPGTLETISFPLTNTYTIQSTQWRPIFNQELINSRKFYLSPSYTVSNAINHLNWFFTQKSETSVASPPPLPFLMEDKVFIDETALQGTSTTFPWATNGTSITRSDGRYIYHSRIFRTAAPGNAILQGKFVQDSVYDTDNYEDTKTRTVNLLTYFYEYTARAAGSTTVGEGLAGFGSTDGWKRPSSPPFADQLDYTYNIYSHYGLYWRFDSKTNQITFSSASLGTEIDNSGGAARYGAAALWLNGMHPADPTYRLWVAYKQLYSSLSEWFVASEFLTESNGFLNRWPETLTYNEDNGYLSIVTTLVGWDTPRIFTKKVEPITYGYANIPIFELPDNFSPTLTTEQQMLNRGWVNEGLIPQNGLNPLEQYFAFKP